MSDRFNADGQRFDPSDLTLALGAAHSERLRALEAAVYARRLGRAADGQAPPGAGAPAAAGDRAAAKALERAHEPFDVVLVGGGLSTLIVPLLAQRGCKVAVVEQARGPAVHREWNASANELAVLVALQLCTEDELDALIVARYRHGTCSWHGHAATTVRGVLDCAVDATGLLALARRRAEAAGAVWFEGIRVTEICPSADEVAVTLRQGQHVATLRARAALDGRGVQSPLSRADLLCPTVGGVLEGLTEGEAPTQYQPDVGEILATVADEEDGKQYLWEAFPGRPGQLTVYLFAYYRAEDPVDRAVLSQLYERFWHTLARFKEGRPRLVRPTYGIISGWSRTRAGAASPHRRIVLLGDAAARHSPLTFCGFGAMLRSLLPTLQTVGALLDDKPASKVAAPDAPLHTLTGALAKMMARPLAPQGALNALLAASFATLADMGNDAYQRLLQDNMGPGEAIRFLWQTSRRHPIVWRHVQRSLGLTGSAALAGRLLRATWRPQDIRQLPGAL